MVINLAGFAAASSGPASLGGGGIYGRRRHVHKDGHRPIVDSCSYLLSGGHVLGPLAADGR